MRYTLLHIKQTIWTVAAIMMLTLVCSVLPGCSEAQSEEFDVPEASTSAKEMIRLSFEVEVPTIHDSRTTPAGNYNDGRLVDFENYIDPSSCQVLIFNCGTGNTTLRGMLTDLTVEVRESNDRHQAKRYTIWGYIEPEIFDEGNFKIMTLANWDVRFSTSESPAPGETRITPGVTTIDDISAGSLYGYSDTWRLGTNYIPMYGIKDCYNIILPDNHMAWLDTMHMLRAMAKVEVVADPEAEITRVILYNYSAAGYAAPYEVYSQSDYVTGSYKDDYTDYTFIPGASIVASSIELPYFTDADSKKHFFIYLPEYKNADDTAATLANASYIDIFFKDATVAARLDFRYYDEAFASNFDANKGDAFDIQRNYYYRFSVKDVKHELNVEVYPYTVVDLTPEYGVETGEPIWEDVWSAADIPEAMNNLSTGHFNWSMIEEGQDLRLYFFDRTPSDAPATEFFWISIRQFDNGSTPITGTKLQYKIEETENNGTLLVIPLTQAMIDDIVAHRGISIMARYCILYRVTIK